MCTKHTIRRNLNKVGRYWFAPAFTAVFEVSSSEERLVKECAGGLKVDT